MAEVLGSASRVRRRTDILTVDRFYPYQCAEKGHWHRLVIARSSLHFERWSASAQEILSEPQLATWQVDSAETAAKPINTPMGN